MPQWLTYIRGRAKIAVSTCLFPTRTDWRPGLLFLSLWRSKLSDRHVYDSKVDSPWGQVIIIIIISYFCCIFPNPHALLVCYCFLAVSETNDCWFQFRHRCNDGKICHVNTLHTTIHILPCFECTNLLTLFIALSRYTRNVTRRPISWYHQQWVSVCRYLGAQTLPTWPI